MLDIEIKKLIEVTGGQLVAGDIDKYGSERISGITYDSRLHILPHPVLTGCQ